MQKVKIYSLPTSHHCRHAKEFLSRNGVEYVEFDIGSYRPCLFHRKWRSH
jgi:arsenate reductase-like glutaredoxin family protein